MKEIPVPVSPGELIDKLTILKIKTERISHEEKLRNIHYELAILENVREDSVGSNAVLDALTLELKTVNEKLWEIEDELRGCELRGDFGERFIELARSVYVTNDERAEIKRKINVRLGSQLVEEKSYSEYRRSA